MRIADLWRGRPHRAIWAFVRGDRRIEARWFWSRFLDAATIVGSRRAWGVGRARVFGRPLAAWLLAALWLAVPLLLLGSVFGHLDRMVSR